MDGKQKCGKMHAWKANKSMGKCRNMMYNGENGNMGKCRIDNTGNGIKAMETWKAKMQDMSWEAEGMKAKCRNPGN